MALELVARSFAIISFVFGAGFGHELVLLGPAFAHAGFHTIGSIADNVRGDATEDRFDPLEDVSLLSPHG
jgi:hypothetical protein